MKSAAAWCILPATMARFYDKRIWRDRTRKQALHDGGYQCDRCGVSLVAKGNANVHHIKPVRTTMALAVEPMNLKCLCRRCHTAIHNELKSDRIKGGCDPSGYPLDPRHPWNVEARGAVLKNQR